MIVSLMIFSLLPLHFSHCFTTSDGEPRSCLERLIRDFERSLVLEHGILPRLCTLLPELDRTDTIIELSMFPFTLLGSTRIYPELSAGSTRRFTELVKLMMNRVLLLNSILLSNRLLLLEVSLDTVSLRTISS